MSESQNSTSGSTSTEAAEETADLALNHDEVLDLELALGALGGIRHSASCEAAERSTRRFDERNHRLHESRMKALGMEGDEKEPEAEDMSHQVLIRSPINHHHHYPPNGSQHQQPHTPTPATPQPAAANMPAWVKAAVAAALLGAGSLGGAGAASLLLNRDKGPDFVDTDTDTRSGIGLVSPAPPKTGDP